MTVNISNSRIQDYKCALINLNPEDPNMVDYQNNLSLKKAHSNTRAYITKNFTWNAKDNPSGSVLSEKIAKTFSEKKINEVSIIGHSQYYDNNNKPLPINKRALANASLIDSVSVIVDIVLKYKVEKVKFYVCEMASYRRDNLDSSSLMKKKPAPYLPFKKIQNSLSQTDQTIETSTEYSSLEYVAYQITKTLKAYDNRSITVQGLNGIGFMSSATKDNHFRPKSLVITQEYYAKWLDLQKSLDHNSDKIKAVKDFEEKYTLPDHLAHKLQYKIPPSEKRLTY